jgi:hypothetical protein
VNRRDLFLAVDDGAWFRVPFFFFLSGGGLVLCVDEIFSFKNLLFFMACFSLSLLIVSSVFLDTPGDFKIIFLHHRSQTFLAFISPNTSIMGSLTIKLCLSYLVPLV